MAINDVSLTAGMRANLLALQDTVNLLNRTQSRLSTGKKVNTAIDNPVSFFASQALTSRASIIDSLKDAMGQAVQTITAADKGIKAITSMIEQAKGVAQSAQSAETGGAAATGAVTISAMSAGGGFATGTLGVISVIENNVITFRLDGVGGLIGFQAAYDDSTPERYLLVDGDMNATAENLAEKINARDYTGGQWRYEAQYVAGTNTMDIFKYDIGTGLQVDFVVVDFGASNGFYSKTVNPAPAPDRVEIGGVTFTATEGATAGQNFNVSGNDEADMQQLAQAINDYAWGATVFSATVTNGELILSKTVGGVDTSVEAGDFDASGVTGGAAAMNIVQSSSELESLQTQYNTLRTQLTELAEDSGYKGKNLLSDDDLVVKFEGTTLTVEGFDASAAGLGITEATWSTGGSIDADVDLLDAALVTLRQESSKMSGNLSIITVRQEFSTNMINTLTEGSDKLTLADTNEEGANMLMLQTRQSLSTTALSLSAQAAQSVLRLFQ